MSRALVLMLVLVATGSAAAQESAQYRVTEYSFQAAGHPSGAGALASAGFQVTLDSLGEPFAGGPQRVQVGSVAPYRPPGEIALLLFSDTATLFWTSEASAGSYALYRGSIGVPWDTAYGGCLLTTVGNSASDASVPSPGTANFYLATARNLVLEEGTKGRSSSGAPRGNPAPCAGGN